jgi:hypothetical protein
MAFDFSALSPEGRAGYIRIGRQWGSDDTLDQANKTLKALERYGAELVRHGFATEDAVMLRDARDGLVEEGVGRAGEVGVKKVTSKTYVDAIQTGKSQRESARSILSGVARVLRDRGGADDTVRTITTALEQTRTAEDDADKLAGQLTTLREPLTNAVVATAAENRGGPQAVAALNTQIEALRAAAKERATGPGTPAATERLDILDGIIISLARAARKAARAASKRLGTPAMLVEFELSHLYSPRPATPATPKTPGAASGGAAPATKAGETSG